MSNRAMAREYISFWAWLLLEHFYKIKKRKGKNKQDQLLGQLGWINYLEETQPGASWGIL